MQITDRVAAAKKAYDEAMNIGAMQSDAFHAAITAALSAAEPVVEPTIYVSRKSVDELLDAKGSHVALQTVIHRKPLKSGNDVPLYAAPPAPSVAVKALKPFSTDADIYDGQDIDDGEKSFKDNITVGDLRRARTAYAALSAQVQDADDRAAINLGASVLSQIADPAARETAIKNALVVASNRSAQVQDVARDLPSEFEKWWDDAGHYVGGVVKMTYTQRKQLAWDAFYASANPAAPAKQEGGHD